MSDKEKAPGSALQQDLEKLTFVGTNVQTLLNGRYAPILEKFQDIVTAQNSNGYKKQYKVVVIRPQNKVETPDLNTADQREGKTFNSEENMSIPNSDVSSISPNSSSSGLVLSNSQGFETIDCGAYSEPYKLGKDLEDSFTSSGRSPQILPLSQARILPLSTHILPLSQAQISQDSQVQIPQDSQAHTSQVSQAQLSQDSQAQLSQDSQAQLSQDSQVQISQVSQVQISQDSQAQISQDSQAQISQDSPVQISQDSQAQISQDSQAQISQDSQVQISQDSQAQISQDSQAQISQDSGDLKTKDCETYSEPSQFVLASSCAPYKPESDSEGNYTLCSQSPRISPVSQHFKSGDTAVHSEPAKFVFASSCAPYKPESNVKDSLTVSSPSPQTSPASQADSEPDQEASQLILLSAAGPAEDLELYGQPPVLLDGDQWDEYHVSVKFQPLSLQELHAFISGEGEMHLLGHGRKFPNPIEQQIQAKPYMYKCDKCDLHFVTGREFNKHIKKQCFSRCAECKQVFNRSGDTQCRQCYHHSVCWICSKKFRTMKRLRLHYRAHGVLLKEIMFRCADCEELFPFAKRFDLCQHLSAKTDLRDNLRFRCFICIHVCATVALFIEHMKEHQSCSREKYKCPLCSQIYVNKHCFQKHMRIKKHRLKCRICKKCFIYVGGSENRQFDLTSEERNDEDPFRCAQCKVRFEWNLTLLKYHLVQKTHKCQVCSKMFSKLFLLKSHMNTHAVYSNRSCYVCGKKFNHKRNLKLHMRKHVFHPSLTCKVCPKKFAHRHHLNLHKEIHQRKKFFCVICNKGIHKLYRFVRHLKLHQRNSRSQNKDSDQSKIVQIHLQSVLHKRTHMRRLCLCHICGKMFTRVLSYNHHMKEHAAR